MITTTEAAAPKVLNHQVADGSSGEGPDRKARTKEHHVTSSLSGGPRLRSSLRSAEGKGTVHIEDHFDTSIDELWSALTDPGRLAGWLGAFEGDLRVGGEFQARFFASGWEGAGRIEACDRPRHLLVRMTETGATDADVMEVTLRADGECTALVVEQRSVPRDQLAAYGAGLQVHVEDLAAYLRGGERCDARLRWSELLPSYTAKASDLG